MHSSPFFLSDVAGFLGGYYAFIAAMNGVFAYLLWRKHGQPGWALVWTVFAGAMMVLSSLALSGSPSLAPFPFRRPRGPTYCHSRNTHPLVRQPTREGAEARAKPVGNPTQDHGGRGEAGLGAERLACCDVM